MPIALDLTQAFRVGGQPVDEWVGIVVLVRGTGPVLAGLMKDMPVVRGAGHGGIGRGGALA